MLNLHLYTSFCFLAFIISFTPGPNVLLMVKYGLEYKLNKAVFPIPGIALALFTYAMIVAIGLARVITHYPKTYEFIRVGGACYLIYMGLNGFYKLYQNKSKPCDIHLQKEPCRKSLFLSGYICALTNPKILVIYLVFLPQFVDPAIKPFPQFLILSLTHILIVITSMLTYCLLANKSQNYIKKYSKIQSSFTNLILIILGIFLIFENFNIKLF